MKVQSLGISTTSFMKATQKQNLSTVNQPAPEKTAKQKNGNLMLYLAAGATVVLAGMYIAKRGKINKVKVTKPENPLTDGVSDYVKSLAAGLEEYLGKPVKPENLTSVMDKKGFLEAASVLNPENFVASKENIEKGIFKADLHSHSIFSDGKATVEEILDEVSGYADKLHEKTDDKFLFALTDHDSVEGVKKALGIISENPDKFKNVKFVTGSEVSYLIKSDKGNPVEPTELLVYGFNPFAENVNNLLEGVTKRRFEARRNYINDLSEKFPDTKFSEEEFNEVFLTDKHSHNPIMNSYWETYHYGQVKKVLSDTAKAKGENPEEFFAQTMENAPDKLNLYEFKQKGLVEGWISDNPEINKLNENYKPFINEDGSIAKRSENTLEDVAGAFKDEHDCTIGFAHPFYITQRTSDAEGVIKDAKTALGDKLVLNESYHQAYLPDINPFDINRINNIAEGVTTQKIGGRDNHNAKWLDIEI